MAPRGQTDPPTRSQRPRMNGKVHCRVRSTTSFARRVRSRHSLANTPIPKPSAHIDVAHVRPSCSHPRRSLTLTVDGLRSSRHSLAMRSCCSRIGHCWAVFGLRLGAPPAVATWDTFLRAKVMGLPRISGGASTRSASLSSRQKARASRRLNSRLLNGRALNGRRLNSVRVRDDQ